MNYLTDRALYQIFKTFLNISSKNMKHVNNIEKILSFEIKVVIDCVYYVNFLTPEAIKLPGKTIKQDNFG